MDSIQVTLREPTANGRLYYAYDPKIEATITYIHNPNLRAKAYSIIISYRIRLYIDPDLVLYFADFDLPIRDWTVSAIKPPTFSKMADIGFEQSTKKVIHVEMPIAVDTDASNSFAIVRFGQPASPEVIWAGLSRQCAALVDDGCLKGFFVDRRH